MPQGQEYKNDMAQPLFLKNQPVDSAIQPSPSTSVAIVEVAPALDSAVNDQQWTKVNKMVAGSCFRL